MHQSAALRTDAARSALFARTWLSPIVITTTAAMAALLFLISWRTSLIHQMAGRVAMDANAVTAVSAARLGVSQRGEE
jgi:hypothetical protein